MQDVHRISAVHSSGRDMLGLTLPFQDLIVNGSATQPWQTYTTWRKLPLFGEPLRSRHLFLYGTVQYHGGGSMSAWQRVTLLDSCVCAGGSADPLTAFTYSGCMRLVRDAWSLDEVGVCFWW